MSPERTASQIGQLIAALSKSAGKKLPQPWTPGDFVSLVAEYKNLVAEIKEGSAKEADSLKGSLSRQQVESWVEKHGIPGAYERMEKEVREADKVMRRTHKEL